jgi:hypothetical protein
MADQYPYLCSKCGEPLDYEDDGRGLGVVKIEPCGKCNSVGGVLKLKQNWYQKVEATKGGWFSSPQPEKEYWSFRVEGINGCIIDGYILDIDTQNGVYSYYITKCVDSEPVSLIVRGTASTFKEAKQKMLQGWYDYENRPNSILKILKNIDSGE